MLVVAAISASVEAPRLAHAPLRAATEELVDAPAAIQKAATRVAASVTKKGTESHLGFDTNVFPGFKAMRAWKRFGKYEWVGYYLPAVCHKDESWSGKRERLVTEGWGLAVIYVGQQTWGRRINPHARAKRGQTCGTVFVNARHGAADAKDAIRRARADGFPKGTVVFLDVEHMNSIPKAMRDYYKAWTRTLLRDGRYRPGIYAHTRNAETIYGDVSDVFEAEDASFDPPFWIAGTSGFDIDKPPTDVGHEFAAVWQGMLDVVRKHNGVRLPIDINVASVPSPSSHEYATTE